MRLRHIEILHAIQKAGSLSAAADLLAITQPAVSKILKHAEQQVGFILFNRVRGRLHPTDQAVILMKEIDRVFEAIEGARRLAKALRSDLDTHLRVACLPSLGMGLVPQAVQVFHRRCPRVGIEIGCRHDPEIIEGLIARDVDIGIGFGPSGGAVLPPGLGSSIVDVGNLVYIEPSDRPGGERFLAPISLADIDQKRLIGLNAMHLLGTAIQNAFENRGIGLNPAVQVETNYVAKSLVAGGTGCAVIDEFTARIHPEGLAVHPLDPPVRFGVYAYHNELHPLSRRGVEFVDCLRTICQEARFPGSAPVRP